MAVTESSPKQVEQLTPQKVRAAGVASAVLGLAGAAGILTFMLLKRGTLPASVAGTLGAWAFVMAVICSSGVQLLRGRVWAQQVLLAFWLLLSLVGLVLAVSTILYGEPAHWAELASFPAPAVGAILLALAGLMTAVTAGASAPLSRLRYGTLVSVSVAVALAALVVANLVFQSPDTYLRRDVESIGQYRLSDKSVKILKDLSEPVSLTMVYTSTDEKKKTDERRPRVWELLSEMHEVSPKVQIARITNDSEKAALVRRLSEQRAQTASGHVKVLRDYLADANTLAPALAAAEKQWDALAEGYLEQWSLPTRIADALKKLSGLLKQNTMKIQTEMTGLADHAKLVKDLQDTLDKAQKVFATAQEELTAVSKVPAAVAANKADAVGAMDVAVKSVEETLKVLDNPPAATSTATSAPAGGKAAAALRAFVLAAGRAGKLCSAAAGKLDAIAGPENVDVVRSSQAWALDMGKDVMVLDRQPTISDEFLGMDRVMQRLAAQAKYHADSSNPETQETFLKSLKEALATKLIVPLKKARDNAAKAIDVLAKVDEASQPALKLAAEGKSFETLDKPIAGLLEAIKKLPALENTSVTSDLTEENIVVVEAGGKTEVVSFDQVWPLKVAPTMSMYAPADQEQRRTFNGDSAISARILAMTQKPFARVLMAYVEIPQQMQRMVPPDSAPSPANFGELRKRLEQANMKVDDWELSKEMPEPNDPKLEGVPTVLLVLTPPPTMPNMGNNPEEAIGSGLTPAHIQKVRQAVDSGTPAIFMTQYLFPMQSMPWMPPMPRDYKWNDYLRADWGIEAMTSYLVMPAVPDETQAGRFKFAPMKFYFFPLSTFSDQPIGKPLQGQRLLWRFLCPVQKTGEGMAAMGGAAAGPKGVDVEPVLSVPATWNSVWATSDIERYSKQIDSGEGSFIKPDYDKGDIPAPFDVAVAAKRAGGGRIVVMGLSAGLQDGLLDRRTVDWDERGGMVTQDPPRANAEVVINSALWLTGHENYIASGPIQVQPIKMMSEAARQSLWALCVVVLPVAVIVLGVGVMVLRRR